MTDEKKTAAQLEALRELAWQYAQSRLWGKPRRFECDDLKEVNSLSREFARDQLAAMQTVEKAKKRLLATGYPAPDSWLTVKAFGDLSVAHEAAQVKKPAFSVLTDTGADLDTLEAVGREMYLAAMRLEVAIGNELDDTRPSKATVETTNPMPAPPGEWSLPMSKAEMCSPGQHDQGQV